jgi:hypothetical protein
MEIIISIVSVLSTLVVVGVVLSFVVLRKSIKEKVDVEVFHSLERYITQELEESNRIREQEINDVHSHLSHLKEELLRDIDSTHNTIESRCDKLYDEISKVKTNNKSKELLTD